MKRSTALSAGLLALTVAGCSDGAGPGPSVSLSFATRLPAGAPGGAPSFGAPRSADIMMAGDTLTDGTNTLVITSAEIVLREIQLKLADVAACEAQPEGCEDFEIGPVLVDLPLGAGTDVQVTVDIPPGAYTEVEFEIHKLSNDDSQDAPLVLLRPDFVGKSIRVRGTFNGQDFTYESDLDVEQELEFADPLVISDSTMGTNLTIRVVLADWFRSLSGGLVNPATANVGQPNEGLVKENIKRSMKVFEDRDQDGDEDEN